jgi:hypothetical protein
MTMKYALAMIATGATLLAGASQVKAELYTGQSIGDGPTNTIGADPIGTFKYNDGSNVASALIDYTILGPGLDLATSGTLTVTGGNAIGTYNLISGGPATFLSPEGAFLANNLLHPGSDPLLDNWGLLFGNGSTEINIWGDSPGVYSFWAYTPSAGYEVASTGSAAVSFSPEPSSIAIAALGGLGLFGYLIRRSRTA